MPFKYASLFERLVANTAEPENDQACWIWTGKRCRSGYGRFNVRVGDRILARSAHVAVGEITQGPAPAGHEWDHLCGVRPCINPNHLEPVTASENCRRRGGVR